MGVIISTVKAVIDFASSAKKEVDREKNRKLQKEADRIAKPIPPPQFWPTLEARRKNTPTGPYSVDGIRLALSKLVLPVGWSEEQLTNVGFADEVIKYQKEVATERTNPSSSNALSRR